MRHGERQTGNRLEPADRRQTGTKQRTRQATFIDVLKSLFGRRGSERSERLARRAAQKAKKMLLWLVLFRCFVTDVRRTAGDRLFPTDERRLRQLYGRTTHGLQT